MRILSLVFVCLSIQSISLLAQAEHAWLDPAKDLERLGSDESPLFWTPEQQIVGYRNWDKIFPTRIIPKGNKVYSLPKKLISLDNLKFNFKGESVTVDEYFKRQNVAGLLVIKNGHIVYERYGLGNTEDTLWCSFSVAKSVTSLLVGAAIKDGYINNVDEKVTDYLPRLRGSSYEQSSIRNILQMASGVKWNEDYADPKADINMMPWDARGLYKYLAIKPRIHPPGKVFKYNSAETNLVGTLLRSAIGNNLSTYLSDKIWKPFGMEHEANWELGLPGGGETSGSSISASLRDFGRIGMFTLANGRLADGTSILTDNWIQDSITPSIAKKNYGYLWWLDSPVSYEAMGIFGQAIIVYPKEDVVIAMHSARSTASGLSDIKFQHALFSAMRDAVK